MRKVALILCFILISMYLAGCESAFFQTIFQEQEWSQNYALAEEVEVTLPEKKSIRKIVIRSEDLSTFDVLASMGEKEGWKLVKEFEKNTEKEIVIRTSVVTDKIKIRARGKESFEGTERAIVHGGVMALRSAKITEPEIQEIELYGFK